MESLYRDMERRGRAGISHAHVDLQEIVVLRGADMRYVGQEHAVSVELPTELFAAQDRDGIKALLRCRAREALRLCLAGRAGRNRQSALRRGRSDEEAALSSRSSRRGRAAGAARSRQSSGLFRRARALSIPRPTIARIWLPAIRIEGPALIEEYASTTVVHPGDALDVDGLGNLVIDTGRS